jgi:RHS repeat-associated protein
MTSIDGLTATWDYKDRLVALEGPGFRAEYRYDYSDRRITKRVDWSQQTGGRRSGEVVVTQYPSRFFEVRDPQQPVKFVFLGDERVADITGTLDPTAQRVQRVRVSEGWNLIALAVQAPDAETQLGVGLGDPIDAVYVWDPEDGTFRDATGPTDFASDAVLWLHAIRGAVLPLSGSYAAIREGQIPASQGPFGTTRLEKVHIQSTSPVPVMIWDELNARWRVGLKEPLTEASDAFLELGPGRAAFLDRLTSSSEVDLVLPPATARIRYRHADHLGSSNLITDQGGRLVEETSFYPYGERRSHLELDDHGLSSADYLFTGKERDEESGLQYFETRYLSGSIGQFVTADEVLTPTALAEPRRANAYGHPLRNPIRFRDPNGQSPFSAVDWLSDGMTAMGIAGPAAGGDASGTVDGMISSIAGLGGAGASLGFGAFFMGVDLVGRKWAQEARIEKREKHYAASEVFDLNLKLTEERTRRYNEFYGTSLESVPLSAKGARRVEVLSDRLSDLIALGRLEGLGNGTDAAVLEREACCWPRAGFTGTYGVSSFRAGGEEAEWYNSHWGDGKIHKDGGRSFIWSREVRRLRREIEAVYSEETEFPNGAGATRSGWDSQ